MKFLVFDTKFVSGVNPDSPALATHGTIQNLDEAWDPKATDAHFVGYLPDAGDKFPRVNKNDIAWAEGSDAKLHWLCFDIDNPGHSEWESTDDAQAALESTLEGLPLVFRDYAGGYTTRAGLRVCVHLGQPVELRFADHLLQYIGDTLMGDLGIDVDPACYQWTRLFRLPQTLRDGVPFSSAMEIPETFQGDIHKALSLTPKETSNATPVDGEFPDHPVEIPDYIWKRNIRFPEVTRGDALFADDDPEQSGSIFRAARSAMAHIAGQANITDPTILISCMWNSLLMSGREPADLWRMACWICGQQESKIAETEVRPEWPEVRPEVGRDPSKPRDSWLRATKKAVAAFGKDYMTETFRLLTKGHPIKVNRNGSFQALSKFCKDVLAKSTLGEDPHVVYEFILPSFRATTSSIVENEQDLWDLCVEAADSSWESQAQGQKQTDLAQEISELRASWPLIITTGHGYYALDARTGHGNYTYRSVASDLAVPVMRAMQRDLPIDLDAATLGPKGGMLSAPQVLDKAGAVVDSVAYHSGLESARFRDSRRSLQLPCHQRSDVVPKRTPEVEEWMRLFAGDQYNRLCRWTAAATKTTTGPLACLYLQGPPGCGKSLYFHGLEKLWAGPRADYNQVANARFADGLVHSPLLVADEGINVKKFSDGANSPSATFRSLTANFTHTVEEKYKGTSQVNAYFRVGITANNSDALPFRETLAKAGIEAIVERVMWIGVNEEAKAYLTNLFEDPKVKAGWIHGNTLAQHFAWLATLDITPDGRFMVQGQLTDWHRRFVQQQGIKPEINRVLSGIANRLLSAPTRATIHAYLTKEGVHITRGKVLDNWPEGYKLPRYAAVQRAIEAMADLGRTSRSDDGQRPGAVTFWGIPWSTVIASGELRDADRKKIEDPTTWSKNDV